MPENPDATLFVSSMDGGGAHKMVVHIAKGLAARGYDTEILLLKNKGPLLKTIPENVYVTELGANNASKSVPSLVSYLMKKKPTSLLATPVSVTIPAILANVVSPTNTKVVIRVPTVLSNARFYTNPESVSDHLLPKLISHIYPYADHHIAISQGVAIDLANSFNIHNKYISTIYNPSITDEVYDRMAKKIEHEFFQADLPVFLGVGRLVDQKDFSTLIKAFDYLLDYQDARLIILGEGKKRGYLETLTQERQISSKVSMPGFVENPYAYMEQADVFVLSSAWEGFGNVIPEAMACGTPVVSTDCESGPREILANGKYGELVCVGDDRSMGNAMLKLLESEIDEDRLVDRAQDFHIDNIIPNYESVLFKHA